MAKELSQERGELRRREEDVDRDERRTGIGMGMVGSRIQALEDRLLNGSLNGTLNGTMNSTFNGTTPGASYQQQHQHQHHQQQQQQRQHQRQREDAEVGFGGEVQGGVIVKQVNRLQEMAAEVERRGRLLDEREDALRRRSQVRYT